MDIAATVSLGINESDNPVEVAHLLREVVQVLLEYPGGDRVNLEIHMKDRRVLMELPVVSVDFCEQLRARLQGLLGSNAVHVAEVDSTADADAVA